LGYLSFDILFVKSFLLYSSTIVFQNVRAIPFIASISLLLLTYFFTVKISKKRFAGIVAMVVLLQSFSFMRYDTLASYSNFWTLFYLLSLYLIYNKWHFSPLSYFLSIFCKPLTTIFFPMTLFFIYNTGLTKTKKFRLTILYLVTFGILIGILVGLGFFAGAQYTFDFEDFWSGFTTWSFQLRFDYLILAFLLPLTCGLFLVSRKGVLEADSILVLIMGTLLSAPLLDAITVANIQPYRFVPFIVFFAIGVGTLLSKKITQQV